MSELLRRDSNAAIFQRLGLNFGKVVKLKQEFKSLLRHSTGENNIRTPKSKPTMAALGSCSAEIRRIYLAKRKKVGLLASQKWGSSFPKFNNPQAKLELEEFARGIAEECAVPEVGFDVEGIIEHIRDYFNEQRRHQKKVGQESSSGESESSPDNSSSKNKKRCLSLPKKPCLPSMDTSSEISQNTDHEDNENTSDDDNGDTDDTMILYSQESPDQSQFSESANFQLQPDVNIPPKVCNLINKSVCGGKVLKDRGSVMKILKDDFSVNNNTLTDLIHSQLIQVLAKKLIKQQYVIFHKDIVNLENLTRKDFMVKKSLTF